MARHSEAEACGCVAGANRSESGHTRFGPVAEKRTPPFKVDTPIWTAHFIREWTHPFWTARLGPVAESRLRRSKWTHPFGPVAQTGMSTFDANGCVHPQRVCPLSTATQGRSYP